MMPKRLLEDQVGDFDAVEQVVADPLRFKRKLAIGEDAYASLRLGKTLSQLWDIGGVAVAGGTAAASTTVAGTFFATGGWLSAIGLGATAVTPVGWVVGAALMTGGAYYGVTRLLRTYHGSRVDVIPKFINTPIDLLGATLMDMIGGLSLKVAHMDGLVTQPERAAIEEYFIAEWGFDRHYVALALAIIEDNVSNSTLNEMVGTLRDFAKANPDCNFDVMRTEIVAFLKEVAAADGKLDEREDLAIEKVEALFKDSGTVEAIAKTVASAPAEALSVASQMVQSVKRLF